MKKVFALMLLALAGCDDRSPPADPPVTEVPVEDHGAGDPPLENEEPIG